MSVICAAEILCVGTELLLGDIVNTNAACEVVFHASSKVLREEKVRFSVCSCNVEALNALCCGLAVNCVCHLYVLQNTIVFRLSPFVLTFSHNIEGHSRTENVGFYIKKAPLSQ